MWRWHGHDDAIFADHVDNIYLCCLSVLVINIYCLAGANPAVNTPRPSRGTRRESCDFFCLDW